MAKKATDDDMILKLSRPYAFEEETIEDVETSDETENAAEASDETEDAARMITTRECFTRGIYFNDTGYYMNKLF